MANYQDSNLNQVVFNKVTKEQYDSQVSSGSIKENEFYLVSGDVEIPAIGVDTNGKVLSNDGSKLNWVESTSGSSDYTDLTNKPQINSIELSGNKSLDDLGIQAKGEYALSSDLSTKADKDNTYTKDDVDGKLATKLSTSQITNCLTEIPQDIKLELNDGTLTLKAGSKVYKGDGTAVTIDSDMTHNVSENTGKFFFVMETNNIIARCEIDKSYSQDTEPTDITIGSLWYNTTTKEIKRYNGSTWNNVISLPLCICSLSKGAVTSIDQIFNGFGYIGSNIFALPGVKGLIPNGRNADGSLKNIEVILDKVIAKNYSTTGGDWVIGLHSSGFGLYKLIYDSDANKNSANDITQAVANAGNVSLLNGRITSLTPSTAFHAVNYSEYAREVGRCAKLDEKSVFTVAPEISSSGECRIFTTKQTIAQGDTPPANVLLGGLRLQEKNEVALAEFSSYVNPQGSVVTLMSAKNPNVEESDVAYAQIIYPKSGNPYFLIPTPDVGDNSTKGATTEWVNNKFKVVSVFPAEPDANVFYFISEE